MWFIRLVEKLGRIGSLVMLMLLVLPVSTSFWIVSTWIVGASEDFKPISPVRWLLAFLLPILAAGWGLKNRSLDWTGAIVGFYMGCVLSLSSYCFTIAMLIFFIISTQASQFRSHLKAQLDNTGGRRSWIQVICNGGVAAQLALLYVIDNGHGERAVNFSGQGYRSSWMSMAVLASIASCCGDTLASEIGSVVGGSSPYLLFSFKKVPRGTNGAISICGLLSSLLGGFLVGLAYYISLRYFCHSESTVRDPAQWPVLIVGAASGLLGSLVDSILGASVQYSGWDEKRKKIVGAPGEGITWISGVALLDNNGVNLLSSLIMALVVPSLAISLWEEKY